MLRAMRMLRPLRAIQALPEMKVLIDSLVESAKPMANVSSSLERTMPWGHAVVAVAVAVGGGRLR